REGLCAIGAVRDGQVRAARACAEHGARIVAAGYSCGTFRHRRRYPQHHAAGPGEPAGFVPRPGCDCVELLERAATATQRLDLGAGIAALGGEVLSGHSGAREVRTRNLEIPGLVLRTI